MVKKDTQILPVIRENTFKRIGVIGAEPKCGATFVCELLKREKNCICAREGSDEQTRSIEIIDMGDIEVTEELDCVLIVTDCRNEFSDRVVFAIKAFRRKKIECAIVFNHWYESFEIPQNLCEAKTDVTSFKIPSIRLQGFMDLYNFTLYN